MTLNFSQGYQICLYLLDVYHSYKRFVVTKPNKAGTDCRLHPRFATADTVYDDNVKLCEYISNLRLLAAATHSKTIIIRLE